MDCQNCQPTLLELATGELGTAAGEAARTHLRECASCRAAFDKLALGLRLAQQLPLEPAPAQVGARLLALAEAKAQAVRIAQKTAAPSSPPWRALLEFVSRFAMARQVGMVTISLLIVAVGLWSWPQLRDTSSVPVASNSAAPLSPPAGPSNAPASEAQPAAGVAPAQPLDLKVDMRSGRIRSKEEEGSPANLPKPEAVVAMAEGTRRAEPRLRARSGGAEAEPHERSAERDSPAEKSTLGMAMHRLSDDPNSPPVVASGSGLGSKRKTPSAFPNSPASAAASGDFADKAKPAKNFSDALRVAAGPPAAPPAVARQAAAAPPAASAPGSANRLSASEPAPAARADTEASARPPPQHGADLSRARALAAARGCNAALPAYERVIASAPASAEAGTALIEMAACKRVAGDLVSARALLERATRIDVVAPRARTLLRDIPEAKAADVAAEPRP